MIMATRRRLAADAGTHFRDWNRVVGQCWTDLLRGRNLERGTVMEIGPGFSDKIGLGLAGLRFRGTIILVEPNAAACQWVADRYRELLPDAHVVTVATRVQNLRAPFRIDALLANHVLDDVLLDALIPRSLSARLFSLMKPDAPCAPTFIETWRRILAGALPRPHELAIDVAASIAAMRPGLLAFNDYASWRHGAPMLAPIHRLSREMMFALQSRLRSDGIPCVLRDAGSMRWLTGRSTRAATLP